MTTFKAGDAAWYHGSMRERWGPVKIIAVYDPAVVTEMPNLRYDVLFPDGKKSVLIAYMLFAATEEDFLRRIILESAGVEAEHGNQ